MRQDYLKRLIEPSLALSSMNMTTKETIAARFTVLASNRLSISARRSRHCLSAH
ncbi:hypothetical protein COMA1_11492 [Candidatus Nitrospira nitrosa]|uniref:Uncharacterized protein n=1 Tax=Candidatus Nitrospira nitrosa TaxID=1742972 RepID=A0A0S4LDT2_9BACT|nr:hypothetical protein COMA1_11492 [Candidatus Nitrospira nitrosa]